MTLDPDLLREQFLAAEPFPHLVLDGMFEESELDALLARWPAEADPCWKNVNAEHARKSYSSRLDSLPPAAVSLLLQLNDPAFLQDLERITGIGPLVPDGTFSGGGLTNVPEGGFLKMHSDFNWHEKLGAVRRLNLLLYLNRDWAPGDGGELELWDQGMERCARSVEPLFNRAVLFATSDASYHGHPDPCARARRSVGCYYYTKEPRPDFEHLTLYRRRPGEEFRVPGEPA